MIRRFALALAALAAVAAPGAAQETAAQVSLEPGQRVIVRIAAGGQVEAGAPVGVQPSAFDRQVIGQLLRRQTEARGEDAVALQGERAAPTPVEPGQVRIALLRMEGADGEPATVLSLENGYDRAVRYRAEVFAGLGAQPTDVCTVLPMNRSYEHWPHAVERIELRAIELIEWREGDAPTCG